MSIAPTHDPGAEPELSWTGSKNRAIASRQDPGPDAPGWARAWITERATLWGLPEQVRDDLVSVASELVTNAVTHTRTSVLLLGLTQHQGGVLLAVRDQGRGRACSATLRRPAGAGTLRLPGPDSEHGRGLPLVSALACRWGMTPNAREDGGAGHTVWALVGPPDRDSVALAV
ncbi:ATP-binding protein [Nocardiopsis sp. NPDC006198]|uniref:ATP-binding protein n=1 Tax=Nocardiopsis sp. NPDC006198 TaxID=3154472 RepID=UPI0033BF82ED